MNQYVTKKPVLSDYGLTNERVSFLVNDRNNYIKNKNKNTRFSLEKYPILEFVVALLVFLSFGYLVSLGILFVVSILNGTVGELFHKEVFACIGLCVLVIIVTSFIPYKESDFEYLNKYPKKDEWNNYQRYLDDTKKYNDWLQSQKIDFWKSLDGFSFEKEMQKLFSAQGYDSRLTKSGADGGVDIVLKKDGKTIAVQCKAHKTKISEGIARDLYGVLFAHNYDSGILATVNGASKKTIEFCQGLRDKPISVLDVNDIIKIQEKLR